jgi:glycosyltransferase involved in cell wall biosynthesis
MSCRSITFNHLTFSKIPTYQLTIFTTPEIVEEAGFSNESIPCLTFILKQSNETDAVYFKRNIHLLNKHNYLLINTLQRKFYIYNNLNITIPIALRVHNSQFYWSKNFQNKKYDLTKYKLLIKEIYKLEIVQRKQFLKKADYFFFPSESTYAYAIQTNPFIKTKAHVFPLNFQDSIPSVPKSKEKTLIIPGKVDPLRKDLDFLHTFIKLLAEKPLDFVITLVFLGVTEGEKAKRFIGEILQYSSKRLNIVYFTSIVPLNTYNDYMQKCDIVWCPIYTSTVFQLSKEIYGKTKVSGGVNDAINFGKWCFVPINYSVDNSINKQILTYDSVLDLYELVKEKLANTSEIPLQATDSPYYLENQRTFIQSIFK